MEQKIAEKMHTARLAAKPLPQWSKENVIMSRNAAYQIQAQGIALRESSGEKRVGLKMGLTSEGKRKQMNLDSPLYGELTDKMQIQNGGEFSISGLIHPKIEPEVAFLISQPLSGVVTREQVLEACTGVAAALEILDSRYDQFKYFSMEDVIADNSSSSHFVVGPWRKDFRELNLLNLELKMFVNGKLEQSGLSKEISNDPVQSVIQLCELLHSQGRSLPANSVVLAGAATAAVPLSDQDEVLLTVDHLLDVKVKVNNPLSL
jgi:2-oxo-3-hexenedioate decarboxylase